MLTVSRHASDSKTKSKIQLLKDLYCQILLKRNDGSIIQQQFGLYTGGFFEVRVG